MTEKNIVFDVWGWNVDKQVPVALFREETAEEQDTEDANTWQEVPCANSFLNACHGSVWLQKWRIKRAERLNLSGPFCDDCKRISRNLYGSGRTFPGEPR